MALIRNERQVNFNAVSAVDIHDGTGEPVAYFGATIREDGSIADNSQIRNLEAYKLHKKEVDADRKQFIDYVMEYATKENADE